MKHELFLDWAPDSRDHAALLQRLVDANTSSAGPSGHRTVAVFVRDPGTGEAISGVWASILYGWLFIDLLYVADPDRRQGLGSRLLATVENGALENGCVGAWLTAYDFQSPGFYEKNGYEQFGTVGGAAASGADRQILFYRKSFDH